LCRESLRVLIVNFVQAERRKVAAVQHLCAVLVVRKAKTKAGVLCAAPAIKGGQYCSLYSSPGRAAELGRKGGLRNRHTYEQSNEPVAPPESAADVRRMLAETMAEVKAGKMDPKVANTVAYV
jgi:hypothetical protein